MYYLAPGEISTLVNDEPTRTPQNLILFTVAVYTPSESDPGNCYIVFELGENNEEGAVATFTNNEYMELYQAFNDDEDGSTSSQTVIGDTVSSTDHSGSPMRDSLEAIVTTGHELTIEATPFETENSRGLDLTIGNYDDDGASVTLTEAQRKHFVNMVNDYLTENTKINPASSRVLGVNPFVVDSDGTTQEVTNTTTVAQAASNLLGYDTPDEYW